MQSFDLDHGDITGHVGDLVKVSISNIQPSNTANGNITATANDPSIVSVVPVANSLTADLKLLKVGQTQVIWKSNDGAITKALNVTVA